MYLKHFGFNQKPFNITPNPEFMFLSGTHKEVFAHLLYGIQNHSGFIAVTGEVGTGKTTVLRTLFNQLDDDLYHLAVIFNPSLTALELLQSINREFGIECAAESLLDLQQALNRHLLEKNRAGHTVVLVIDEAQNLAAEVLEQIRLLSNLETETDKLIQIVLVGQPELATMLEQPELRQLRQRITVRYRLEEMNQEDGLRYILHRVEIAGQPRKDLFEPNALQLILKQTKGNPRLINILCDRSLLVAFSADASQVKRRHVEQALQELWREEGGRRPGRAFALCCLLLLVLVVVSFWWLNRVEPPVLSAEPVVSAPPVFSAPQTEPSVPVVAGPAPEPEPEPPLADRMQRLRQQLAEHGTADVSPAFNALTGLWQVESFDPKVPMTPGMLRDKARVRGLELTAFSGSFVDFLQFNLPAILDLSLPGVDSERFLALTGLSSDGFLISPGLPDVDRLQIDELENLWSGHAYLVWKNHADIPFIGITGQRGPAIVELQRLLARVGLYDQPPSGTYDQLSIDAVTRFQADSGLIQDGRIGPQTLILLYRAAGHPEVSLDRISAGKEGA
jgi:general secretion pathway protein A